MAWIAHQPEEGLRGVNDRRERRRAGPERNHRAVPEAEGEVGLDGREDLPEKARGAIGQVRDRDTRAHGDLHLL